MLSALDSLKWDSAGLIPIIIQDFANGQVLAMFWTNRAALEKTIQTQKVHSYSRSRGRIALKGESSGHVQHVKEILADCDKDAVVIKVDQIVAACHEGYRSCFYNKLDASTDTWETTEEKAFDPDAVYSHK